MHFIPSEAANIPIILKECLKQGLTYPKYKEDIAYILATARHETATWRTLQEYGGRQQAIKYGYQGGENYFGRGYVQLTHKNNYQKFENLLGKPFVSQPDLVTDPELAAFILVYGMINGSFTGRKLEHFAYIYGPNEPEVVDGLAKPGDRAINFIMARAIVNGNDQAMLINNYAREYVIRMNKGEFDYILKSPQVIPPNPPMPPVIPNPPTPEIPNRGIEAKWIGNKHYENLIADNNTHQAVAEMIQRDEEIVKLKEERDVLFQEGQEWVTKVGLLEQEANKLRTEIQTKENTHREEIKKLNTEKEEFRIKAEASVIQREVTPREDTNRAKQIEIWFSVFRTFLTSAFFTLSTLGLTSPESIDQLRTDPKAYIITGITLIVQYIAEQNKFKAIKNNTETK